MNRHQPTERERERKEDLLSKRRALFYECPVGGERAEVAATERPDHPKARPFYAERTRPLGPGSPLGASSPSLRSACTATPASGTRQTCTISADDEEEEEQKEEVCQSRSVILLGLSRKARESLFVSFLS